MLKSFDEFLASEFTQEDAVAASKRALESMGAATKNLPMEERLAILASIQANAVVLQEVLRKYHDWLTAQLQ